MSDPNVLRRWLEVEWNDRRAEYVYALKREYKMPDVSWEEWERTGLFGGHFVARSKPMSPPTTIETELLGDREWAGRIAEHYGIDLPKPEAAA